GVTNLADITLADLRSWLGTLAESGAAPSTVARRSAAARTFTQWATRTGRLAHDPARRLGAPRKGQHLPGVLKQREAAELMELAAVAADDDDPVHIRNRAILELLYASGMRVGELTGLDVDDLDLPGQVARVLGKGAKERTVPFGAPAGAALEAWLTGGRPRLVTEESGPALFLGRRGRRVDQR